jgi:hypothetical protein
MTDSENRKLETFVRIVDFGTAHASDFAPASLAKQLFTTLTGIVAELDGHASQHVSSRGAARQGTTTRAEARDALRELMEAIRRTARVMALDVPGLDDKFRVPPVDNDQLLLTSARAFLTDATPLAAQFIAHELPTNFLQNLADAIAALETAMSEQSSGVGNAVAARAAIEETVDQGMDMKRKLDAIVKNKYANNPAVLAEWASASHIERAPKHKATAPQPTTPATGSSTPGAGGDPKPGGSASSSGGSTSGASGTSSSGAGGDDPKPGTGG